MKKMMIILSLACVRFLPVNASAQQSQPVFGRYTGTLKHDKLGQEQLAKLDFIVSRGDMSKINLRAILTLHFGGFESGEYVSYHFDNVEYNLLSGTLVFDQPDQGVSLTVERFGSNTMSASVRSSYTGGEVGHLELTRGKGPSSPQLPLVEPLNGDYRGNCSGKPTALQLTSFRSSEDTFLVGNPFGAYQIKGAMGEQDPLLCDSIKIPNCFTVASRVQSASYNFYTGSLTLLGDIYNYQCRVLPKGIIDCGNGCRLTRTSGEFVNPVLSPLESKATFLPPAGTPTPPSGQESIAGEYEGYLHHEYTDTYQRAKLNVATFRSQTESGSALRVSATANLYFGDVDSSEVLTYRFETIDYPNPLQIPQFVLNRAAADVDATLRITSIKDGVVRGEWYSQLFGRVGDFELRKGALPTLPQNAKLMRPVSGSYAQGSIDLDLAVGLSRTPINSNNPFYPLQIKGYLWPKEWGAKRTIEAASYDFYTDRIALMYGDDKYLTGHRIAPNTLMLRRSAGGFGTLMQNFVLEPYSIH